VALPLAVVLPEELAFRGAVLGALAPSSPLRGVLVSSLAFALWHASIVAPTLRETNVADPFLAALALAGAAAVLLAGGVALALLRLRIGTLASSIAAHWAFNAVLLVGLWLLA
jgi:membrane protease YdiL (CAAX protease family)